MVDILMATYNGEKYLSKQIDSIIAQTYKDWKLYIRDDGSTDNTLKIIKNYKELYPNKIIVVKDNKKGLGAKKNFTELLKYTSSDYCMFSDQDDIWLPFKIENTMKKMKEIEQNESDNLPILIYTDLKVVDKNERILNESYWKYQGLNYKKNKINSLIVENIVTGCTMLLNKKLVQESKKIPDEAIMHDWWIALVASALGKITFLEEQTILYRQHECNEVGANNIKSLKFILDKINKNNIKESINKAIIQAEVFLKIYKKRLSEKDLFILEMFSNINSMSLIKRKITCIKYKLYKRNIIRRLGYIIYI